MEIAVDRVRAGDFVVGFGFVNKVKVFFRQKAIRGKQGNALNRKFVRIDSKTQYARIVAEQQENSYDEEIDTVVFYGATGSKAFAGDAQVKVYRTVREVV